MQTITGSELHEASDGELRALASDMSLGQTWETRNLAKLEVERRELARVTRREIGRAMLPAVMRSQRANY